MLLNTFYKENIIFLHRKGRKYTFCRHGVPLCQLSIAIYISFFLLFLSLFVLTGRKKKAACLLRSDRFMERRPFQACKDTCPNIIGYLFIYARILALFIQDAS